MGPHAQKHSYRLSWFDNEADAEWKDFYEKKPDGVYLDMAGFNRTLFEQAGVKSDNIYVSSVDTARDEDYFSHSSGDKNGRIACLAYMKQDRI